MPSPRPTQFQIPKKIDTDDGNVDTGNGSEGHSHRFSGCDCDDTAPREDTNDKKDSFSVSDEERQGPREHVKPQTFDLNIENIEEDNVDKLGIARPRLNLNHLQVKGPRPLALTQ